LQIREGFAFGYALLYFYFDQEHHSLNPSALEYPQLLFRNQVQECCINTNTGVVKNVPAKQEIFSNTPSFSFYKAHMQIKIQTLQSLTNNLRINFLFL
jgi:hypothetical protein